MDRDLGPAAQQCEGSRVGGAGGGTPLLSGSRVWLRARPRTAVRLSPQPCVCFPLNPGGLGKGGVSE